jgi:hypothetical protein
LGNNSEDLYPTEPTKEKFEHMYIVTTSFCCIQFSNLQVISGSKTIKRAVRRCHKF